MNERIKELAEEAGSTHKQILGVYQFYEYELINFAELVVKEVLAVQEKLIADGHNAWHLTKPTKEHFGVEE